MRYRVCGSQTGIQSLCWECIRDAVCIGSVVVHVLDVCAYVCMWPACDVVDRRILVSIVVSIPACHAGDPGSIPGREVRIVDFRWS